MSLSHRGTIIHQFHRDVHSPSLIPGELPFNAKSIKEGGKRERTSVHTFMNSSNKHQQDSVSDHRQSQSAANLYLYH